LNKLSLPGRLWVASDIHLGPDTPHTAAAFHAFLHDARKKADALILAGDIFDAWIGDDVALASQEPWLKEALHALQLTAARMPLWLGHGNRDFLMGDTLARHLGAGILPDQILLDTDAGPVLLAHGDQYCLADAGYQRFRRMVREPAVQQGFLHLPRSIRQRIASWARKRSMAANRYKSKEIMDVTPAAVARALRSVSARTLIHGHTHRPGTHQFELDGRQVQRVVLPDWDYDHAFPPRGGWLVIDQSGLQLHDATTELTLHATNHRAHSPQASK